MDEWSRIEDPEINPHIYGHLSLINKPKAYSGKKKASSINGVFLPGDLLVE